MKYQLNNLNSSSFEQLVQALAKKLIGNASITFGDGTDGGREATFDGKAPFPSTVENWEGYWVIQAKFKLVTIDDDSKDFNWVKDQLTTELDTYSTRKVKVKNPENYLFFTNVILTAKPKTGGRDKANELEKEFQEKYSIKNIKIISNDDIQDYLNTYRDIAISFSSFILAGDVLHKLLQLLDIKEQRSTRINEIILRFLEIEYKEDIQSKLDHAGKLTSDKINLEKVFIDLYTTEDILGNEDNFKFIDFLIDRDNSFVIQDKPESNITGYVLIAGPGYGKSTLTQFVAQIYRSHFLKNADKSGNLLESVNHFINDLTSIITVSPKRTKLPIRVILKEYAGWINNRYSESSYQDLSLLTYLANSINKKSSSSDLTNEELENIIKSFSCLIIFDGLDEVPISSNRNIVMNEINNFTDTILRRISGDATIVATTRQQGYHNEFNTSKYKQLYITDLNRATCEIYLGRLLDNLISVQSLKEEKLLILKKVLDHGEISRLMKSPLQASIMAILVISGGEPPRNKFDLFFDYFDIIFKREKQRNISKVLNEYPEYIKEIHNKLGFFLQKASEYSINPSATIHISEFHSLVVDYLVDLEIEEGESVIIANDVVKAATERLVFISELKENEIGFAIRSMQEYFASIHYIHNISDEKIRSRLRDISVSSYWSNTLIFAIGYLSKNKKYLVDFIESMCYELNGSGDEFEDISLGSIIKAGSWLALDILNEDMFRPYPTTITKFSKLLEPLLYVSLNNKHGEIIKLPEHIIKKWVIMYLDKSLSDNINYTPWAILNSLIKSKYECLDLHNKYWPSNTVNQRKLLIFLIENNFTDFHITEKFVNYIVMLDELDIEIFHIVNNNEKDFLLKASKYLYEKRIFCKSLFTYAIITSLDQSMHTAANPLIPLFGINLLNLNEENYSLFYFINKYTIELLNSNYSYEIATVTNIVTPLNENILQFSKSNNAILVYNTCNYLKTQIMKISKY